MTLLESKKALCRLLNISYSNVSANTEDLFDWDDIDAWINLAIMEAWDYADWIFKEKAYTTTTSAYVASTGVGEYYNYPDDFISGQVSDGYPERKWQ